MAVASALKGMSKAKVFGNDPYFLPGKYKVQLCKVFLYEGTKGDNFIVRAKIVETSIPDKRPVGMVCGWVVPLKTSPTERQTALGNIRGFCAACLGVDTANEEAMEEVNEEALTELIESDALVGFVMDLTCNTKITKERKVEFTVHNWSLARNEG